MELIVFDLDGTLLNAGSEISPFTRETLALLSKKNIAYTVATGRTLHSARELIDGHGFHLPHIYSNGVIIWDPRSDTMALDNLLTAADTIQIMEAALTHHITPFIFTVDQQGNYCIYHPTLHTDIEKRLRNTFHLRPSASVKSMEHMPSDALITNISVLGEAVKIDAIQHTLSNKSHLVSYSGPAIEGNGYKWMDIHHNSASKGDALQRLREQLGVKKIICFGDSDNDLSMFAMADESYAPDNANDSVKAAATAVINHHDADGVAHYLRERFDM
jgi:Cof subfamily protein (haloacid dehalogenase superfamily)